MVRIHRLTSVLLSGVLALALLLAEYGLLLNYDRSSEQERLRHWGELGAELLAVRLQEALDHTALLTQSLAHQSASLRDPTTLSHIAQTLLRDDSNYRGLGIVRKIMPTQRTAFEAQIANNIRMLKNGHLLPSPSLPVYYPLESYLPDDANALPQGLDMGSLLSSRRTLEMARNRGLPMLLFSTPSNGHRRLDIVTNLDEEGRMLLVNLRSERLVQSSLSTPASNLLLQHVRLVAWTADQPDSPSLDSHPNLPAPVGTPLLTIKHTLGGSDVLFGAYALDSSPPTLSSSGYLMLGLSALLLALLMALHQYQLSANTRLRRQLNRQRQQLEDSNRSLRQQINERLHSEQALAESEALLRAALQASSDAIVLTDQHGKILRANPATARLAGQPAQSLEQLPLGVLLPDFYRLPGEQPFAQLADQHEGTPFETELTRSDQHPLPVELTLNHVVMPNDCFYVAVCRDISLRKQQEAALINLKNSLTEQVEMQSRQLSALLEASPLAMAYIVDRTIKQVNRAFLELFERREADVIDGGTLPYFENPQQWERTGNALFHQINDGLVAQAEVRLLTGQGRPFWCRLFAKALNPSVPKLGAIWLYQDISAQREAEETLRHAKQLAEQSSRAKTEFLANMSHELRTPMHAILGFAEMGQLNVTRLPHDTLARYFQRIHSSGERLLALLNDLLDLSKMDAGRMEYHLAEHNLVACVREACDELTAVATERQLSLKLDAPPQLLGWFDPLRIGQVLRNLLSNAIKFSPAGQEIHIRLGQRPKGGEGDLWVCVEDHGPGVPADEREAIFDKFVQSRFTRTGAGGSGLGLAICREIIHAHHGSIHVRNRPQGGAAFTFILPRQPQLTGASEISHAPSSTPR